MPKVGGGTEVIWRNGGDQVPEDSSAALASPVPVDGTALLGEAEDRAGTGTDKAVGPRRFSPFLLGLIRDRERAQADGDGPRAAELQRQLLEEHGLAVDAETGSWTSRGGWKGELGQEPVYEGPPPSVRKRRRRGKHKPRPCTKEPPRNRHKLFASFLVDTFGRELLNAGSGVLDIAGGKGFVAAQLQDVHGVQCTVIETNPLHGAARIHGSENGGEVVWRELNVRVWKGPFEAVLVPSDNQGAAALSDGELGRTGTPGNRAADPGFGDPCAPTGGRTEELKAMCASCSVLVGMHPDEATDAIVDTAIALNKPFAIVPCCVFASTFPDRRLPDGRPVTYFEDLLEYLKAKHPGVQQTRLNYYGRSHVLYWDPRLDRADRAPDSGDLHQSKEPAEGKQEQDIDGHR